jgi:Na+/H+ antiporter NhaA
MATESTDSSAARFSGRTAWARNLEAPVREFLRTETGGSVLLLAATVGALVWANAGPSSYRSVWSTTLAIRIGSASVSQDLRLWVNNGLMVFFFLVMGLEARREFDLGELRDRRRLILPAAAAVGGMLVPISIYLIANGGRSSAHGWGAAMSTDTAFAVGMLAVVGRRFPQSMRSFVLTVAVVDDLVSFVVIATVYTPSVRLAGLAVGLGALVLVLVARLHRVRNGAIYAVLGLIAWVGLLKSGVDPVIVGVTIGLLSIAYPAARADLNTMPSPRSV